MGKSMVIGKTRTNQPVELDPLVLEMLKTIANYQIEYGTDLDASFKTLQTVGIATIGGNASVGGDLAVTGKITGGEIVENMSGYSFTIPSVDTALTKEYIYAGIVKNGNKLTFVIAFNLTRTDTADSDYLDIGNFNIPLEVANKIYPTNIGGADFVDLKDIILNEGFGSSNKANCYCQKSGQNFNCAMYVSDINTTMTLNKKYYVRYEVTILLSDNLVPQE